MRDAVSCLPGVAWVVAGGVAQQDGENRFILLLLQAPVVAYHGGLPGGLLQLPHLRRGPRVPQSDGGVHSGGGQLFLLPFQQVPRSGVERPQSGVLVAGHSHRARGWEVCLPPTALW